MFERRGGCSGEEVVFGRGGGWWFVDSGRHCCAEVMCLSSSDLVCCYAGSVTEPYCEIGIRVTSMASPICISTHRSTTDRATL